MDVCTGRIVVSQAAESTLCKEANRNMSGLGEHPLQLHHHQRREDWEEQRWGTGWTPEGAPPRASIPGPGGMRPARPLLPPSLSLLAPLDTVVAGYSR